MSREGRRKTQEKTQERQHSGNETMIKSKWEAYQDQQRMY